MSLHTRQNAWQWMPLAAVLLAGVATRAHAADDIKAKDAAPAPAPAAPAPTASAPAKDETKVEQVPDSEKPARSREALVRMRDILTRVLKHLEEARAERDVVKLNCVNEKLAAIKGLLKISEQADITLQESLARRNTEAAQHEFDKITIAQRKTEQLFAESEACVGELAVYAGDTQVEIVVEGVPDHDPTRDMPRIELITRPPAASPYQ